MVEGERVMYLLTDLLSFLEKRLYVTNSIYFGVCFLPVLAGTKSPTSDLQARWIPCTSACFSDQRRQKCTQFTLSTVFLDRNEIELGDLGTSHCKKHLLFHNSSLFTAVTQASVQDKPRRPQRPVCHPWGSQPNPARVLRVLPGAGLALGFRWLTRLSPLEIQGKLSNVNIGLAVPHLKEEGSA